MANSDRRGIYDMEYYSGSQAAIYIGDVLVDEITSISYEVHQSRSPLYGYADPLFRDVSKGVVLVQGSFSINFKEAGYLWLILNRYNQMNGRGNFLSEVAASRGAIDKLGGTIDFWNQDVASATNIEALFNGELSASEKSRTLFDISNALAMGKKFEKTENQINTLNSVRKDLSGFAENLRAGGQMGPAENIFEDYENLIWGNPKEQFDDLHRRADEPDLNPFDIFISFGDYNITPSSKGGNDYFNHTVQKLSRVHIVGSGKQINNDGSPIQEVYTFFCRNLI